MRNDVVKSDIHSTDTHGFSEAIFAVTHLLGVSFAPRIKNLKNQNLYMFRSRRGGDRADWAIKPEQYVDQDSIITAWDDVLRLVATIKLKESTASDIFRRLNSYSRQHSLYTALKAFGRIIKSMFILRYIDDVELRMAIDAYALMLGHGRLRSWLLTAPILALDAVGPSTPTVLYKSCGDPTYKQILKFESKKRSAKRQTARHLSEDVWQRVGARRRLPVRGDFGSMCYT